MYVCMKLRNTVVWGCLVPNFPKCYQHPTVLQGTTEDGGVLDVWVRYEAVCLSNGNSSEDSQHVNITVGILRAAGLKVCPSYYYQQL